MTTFKEENENLPFFPMEKDLFATSDFETLAAILFERYKTRVDKFKGKQITKELMSEVNQETTKFLTEIVDSIS